MGGRVLMLLHIVWQAPANARQTSNSILAHALLCYLPQQRGKQHNPANELAAKHMQSKVTVPVLFDVWAASIDTKGHQHQERAFANKYAILSTCQPC